MMPGRKRHWLLLPPLALIALYAAGLQHALSWQELAARQDELHALVAAHPLAAALAFALFYAVCAAIAFPGTAFLTVAGGLLFGTSAGAALTVAGAGSGAVTLFLLLRTALGPLVAARVGFLERLRPELERDSFSGVLALRLVPVMPFWLVNVAAGLLGVPLLLFLAATILGMVPLTVILAGIGAGIGDVLAAGGQPDLTVILSPPLLLRLLGLALLALLPIAWRRWRQRHA
jgi:uncharacterized membrane protein YdjX (TVP38/TMEM64 family)